MTAHPKYDVKLKISPLNPEDAISAEDQMAEGVEESDVINYDQEFRLFNTSDYIGKSKALTLSYNKNMRLDLYKVTGEDDLDNELIDTFLFEHLEERYNSEIEFQKNEQEKARKRREKKKKEAEAKAANETDGGNSTESSAKKSKT